MRFKYTLFVFVGCVSLSAFMATGMAWLRSYGHGDDIGVNAGYNRCFIRTGAGEVAIEWYSLTAPINDDLLQWDVRPDRDSPYMLRRDTFLLRRGFWASTSDLQAQGKVRSLLMPFWFPTLLLLPVPFLWFALARRMKQRIRASMMRCPACGYDLRASPDRCPECGAVPGSRRAGPPPKSTADEPVHGV
jgi:hypothetical protein